MFGRCIAATVSRVVGPFPLSLPRGGENRKLCVCPGAVNEKYGAVLDKRVGIHSPLPTRTECKGVWQGFGNVRFRRGRVEEKQGR